MSRLHRVVRLADPGAVEVEDVDGVVRRVSLLALDGPEPAPGEWLVVHSGYAVGRADAAEAEEAADLLRGLGRPDRPAEARRSEDRAGSGSGRGMPGVAVAAVTALISGVAVFVNSYGVHDVPSPAVYTAAKNLVAAAALAAVALGGRYLAGRHGLAAAGRFVRVGTGSAPSVPASPAGLRPAGLSPAGPRPDGPRPAGPRAWSPLEWLGLAYVGVVGGGLAFVLYFDALARTTATPAAFWHDTLVVWVALLAYPVLRERVTWWNVAAVSLLVVGQVAVAGGVGHLAATGGEMLALAATVLWAVEVVVAKVLLRRLAPATLSLVRMGVGAATLVVYLAATGSVGALVSLTAVQVGWALLTGLLLAGYVGTWMTALSRARALDVTSVLVLSAVVTWLLQAVSGGAALSLDDVGLVLVAGGAAMAAWAVRRRPGGLGARDEARGG